VRQSKDLTNQNPPLTALQSLYTASINTAYVLNRLDPQEQAGAKGILYTILCYISAVLRALVGAIYKPKAKKILPVNKNKLSGDIPGGCPDWEKKAIE